MSFATMVGESAQAHGASRNTRQPSAPLVAERRNTESVSQHELQILRETQLHLSSTGNGSAVQEGLRLREGTNECVDQGLFTPGISYDDLKNERKSEVHHAELRRHYHWHGTVRTGLGAARAMHIHPTVSEFIPTMMDQLKPLQ